MQTFDIKSKTAIFDLKSNDNKRDSKISDLDKLTQHKVEESSKSPKQEVN